MVWSLTSDIISRYVDRNLQMADEMTRILANATNPPVFVVGLGHWIFGELSFEILLQKEGYFLEAIVGSYDADEYTDLTDAVCAGESQATTMAPATFNKQTPAPTTIQAGAPTSAPSASSTAEDSKTSAPASTDFEDPNEDSGAHHYLSLYKGVTAVVGLVLAL